MGFIFWITRAAGDNARWLLVSYFCVTQDFGRAQRGGICCKIKRGQHGEDGVSVLCSRGRRPLPTHSRSHHDGAVLPTCVAVSTHWPPAPGRLGKGGCKTAPDSSRAAPVSLPLPLSLSHTHTTRTSHKLSDHSASTPRRVPFSPGPLSVLHPCNCEPCSWTQDLCGWPHTPGCPCGCRHQLCVHG